MSAYSHNDVCAWEALFDTYWTDHNGAYMSSKRLRYIESGWLVGLAAMSGCPVCRATLYASGSSRINRSSGRKSSCRAWTIDVFLWAALALSSKHTTYLYPSTSTLALHTVKIHPCSYITEQNNILGALVTVFVKVNCNLPCCGRGWRSGYGW